MGKKIIQASPLLFFLIGIVFCQTIYTEYVVTDSDTVDTFSYQIPFNYLGNEPVPLLVVFHQWGGNESSSYYTEFDEEANNRGWIYLSPYGGSPNNYNHQSAQDYVEWAINWIRNHYLIDSRKIYMVGGSMGGAAGAIFANNHLNPLRPMVAATASGSGILDCERRFYEMDGNNSMMQWFGGTPEEVPFEYHRNSAVYFSDSPQSMHYNLQFTPLYLDLGSSEPHRYHAEDLYNLLLDYNENMWIETEPTGGHGFGIMDEHHTCNWLAQFELEDSPLDINVNLDEPSRAYWAEAINLIQENQFVRLKCSVSSDNTFFDLYEFSNSDSIIFHNTISVQNSYIEIENHNPYMIGDFKVGLTGNDFELLDSVFVTGNQDDFYEILSYTISETVVWIDVPGWMELQFINVQLFFGNFISLEIDINSDWNLIGLPLTTSDPSVAFLFPDAIDGTLFGFRDTYFLIDSLTNGSGYWLRFETNGTSEMSGYPLPSIDIDIVEGWNLISGISTLINVNSINDPDGIIVPETIYGFGETYFISDFLEPAKGYWIRANLSGTITIVSDP